MATGKQIPETLKCSTADDDRDLILTRHEAVAAAPVDVAACGEEDPGAALESLVTHEYEEADSKRED